VFDQISDRCGQPEGIVADDPGINDENGVIRQQSGSNLYSLVENAGENKAAGRLHIRKAAALFFFAPVVPIAPELNGSSSRITSLGHHG
jgi:hypothetical protein